MIDAGAFGACPVPGPPERIQLAHGAGGVLSRRLLDEIILPGFGSAGSLAQHDSAVLPRGDGALAFTSDGYTVRPRRFPGGDIGRLAVCGTVNDLAMSGAAPVALSCAFMLEEGLDIAELAAVAASMGECARAIGVPIVTGDTKVVERGACDGLYVTTSGIGRVPDGVDVHPRRVRPGDAVILSGDVARHGMAVMSARDRLESGTPIESDVASLAAAVAGLIAAGIDVHCLRDATRGGLAAALVDIAEAASVRIDFDETAVPVRDEVRGLCELLGMDPMHVANEGCLVAFVAAADAERTVTALRSDPACRQAKAIGLVAVSDQCMVIARTAVGGERVIDLPVGELLPRIC